MAGLLLSSACVAILAKVLATNCDGQTLLLEVRHTSSTAKTAEFLKKLLHDSVLRASPGGVSGCITDTAASCQRGGLRVSGPAAPRAAQRRSAKPGVRSLRPVLSRYCLPMPRS